MKPIDTVVLQILSDSHVAERGALEECPNRKILEECALAADSDFAIAVRRLVIPRGNDTMTVVIATGWDQHDQLIGGWWTTQDRYPPRVVPDSEFGEQSSSYVMETVARITRAQRRDQLAANHMIKWFALSMTSGFILALILGPGRFGYPNTLPFLLVLVFVMLLLGLLLGFIATGLFVPYEAERSWKTDKLGQLIETLDKDFT